LLASALLIGGLVSACHTPFGVYHTVQSGESLYAIGQTYGVSVAELQQANFIRNANQIRQGEQLFIPGVLKTRKVQKSESGARQASKGTGGPGGKSSGRRVASLSPHGPNGGHFIWPVEGVLTSKYGQRSGNFHAGIDLAAPIGTPVVAADDGEVIHAADQTTGYGNLVIIKHRDNFFTVYGHLSEILVESGERVRKGQVIGKVGNTGRSTGPHLHFEIRHRKDAVDPLTLLP
jgi:lipoprotein NlpD